MCIHIRVYIYVYIYTYSIDDFNNSTNISYIRKNQLFSEVRSDIETITTLARFKVTQTTKNTKRIPSMSTGWFIGIPSMECNNH